eukprot:CAMPEP_0176088222 /NCGR_PEP_ID=MMETSP0120_2-20121206/44174_1 /TAXON_ID=160619 /ORGANISM="Kryptoperidinium foliaceum, Strain CCMP 1326" /LENGTH=206 /DNA_ID=CAMNT_0017422081 /DNA_START=71 /DNA_END=688 /DNA_ORIENTATION=-
MLSTSLARVTRQLTQMRVGATPAVATSSWMDCSSMMARGFASKPSKKKKSAPKAHAPAAGSTAAKPFLQNQEWVKFQQSISVDGFQTGQTLEATVLKKSKGGKQARNRKARELMMQQQQEKPSENRFPAIRYSPEETQDLLKLAYESLPQREGKRGTRNQKRQDRRWKLVRKIRAKYKAQIQAAHERRMEHRKWTRAQTKGVKEAA